MRELEVLRIFYKWNCVFLVQSNAFRREPACGYRKTVCRSRGAPFYIAVQVFYNAMQSFYIVNHLFLS